MDKVLNKYYSNIGEIIHHNSEMRLKIREKVNYKNLNISIGKNTILEPGVKIYPDTIIGESCVLATDCVIKSGCVIGDHTVIGTKTNLEGDNKIGSWTTIQAQCHITMGMTIGDRCFIGPDFSTVNTPRIGTPGCKFGYPNTTNMERKIPIIGDSVQIGGDVTIAPGVKINHNSIIYMKSFIKTDVPSETIVKAHTTWPDDYEV